MFIHFLAICLHELRVDTVHVCSRRRRTRGFRTLKTFSTAGSATDSTTFSWPQTLPMRQLNIN